MIIRKIAAVACVGMAVAAFAPTANATDVDKLAAEGRSTVKSFFGNLKGELVSAMKAGGPVNAVNACNTKAPEVTRASSRQSGWNVGRTSLKLRNPSNVPDAWEKKVLNDFEARKAKGESPKGMEYYEVVDMGGKKTFRYMQAIPTAEKPCLACHGGKIDEKVASVLNSHYPNDKARGYGAGDIRGAFTLSRPLN